MPTERDNIVRIFVRLLDLCEDVESKYKISEIIDSLAEKKPQKQTKSVGNVTPAPRHGRRSALLLIYLCSSISMVLNGLLCADVLTRC